jgi:hypothetical protein
LLDAATLVLVAANSISNNPSNILQAPINAMLVGAFSLPNLFTGHFLLSILNTMPLEERDYILFNGLL